MIVRSICCLPLLSEGRTPPIAAISIVDRFLEHGRVFIFHNGGNERYFIGSTDWMTRNLNRRLEVVLPIFDEEIRSEIRAIIDTQLQDNVKARILDAEMSNRFRPSDGSPIRSQIEIHRLVRDKAASSRHQTPLLD